VHRDKINVVEVVVLVRDVCLSKLYGVDFFAFVCTKKNLQRAAEIRSSMQLNS